MTAAGRPVASRLRPIRAAALLLALALCGPGLAQPGALLGLEPSGSLSADQVAARYAGRFRNNGETPPPARHAVDTYLMRYASLWPDGSEAVITAQLFVPRGVEGERPLFAFAPGSTGLVEECAPSRSFVDAGTYDTYNAYALAYAGQGLVSVMPNYMGFFDVGTIQPYFSRVAEGRVLLDALRATEAALERLDGGLEVGSAFVGGYSQGGHAAFAAADLHASYAPDTPLRGVVGFGPTTDLVDLFLQFTYVAPWVVYSYATFEPGRIDPAEILAEPYLSRLAADAEGLCILGVQQHYPSAPEGLFRDEFTEALRAGTLSERYPEVAELFAENDAGRSGHALPAIILQGVDDPVVSLESQHEFVRVLCETGSRVRYPNYLRTRHETRYIGFAEAVEWMESLAAGQEPPSDCDILPSP